MKDSIFAQSVLLCAMGQCSMWVRVRPMYASPVYLRAGHGLSRSTGGTLLQLAVTAPMMPPATSPVPTAVRVRDTQSSGLSTGNLSDWTEAGILAPEMPLMLASQTP